MKLVAVIPARYGSSRFEGKPLALIGGIPMIVWVYNRVKKSALISEVYVATDDERIAEVCKIHGLAHLMTASNHRTSTERLHEVSQKVDADLYICVNGDEPLVDYRLIEKIIPSSFPNTVPFVANLTCKICSAPEVIDPTNIKVVFSSQGNAQFMSRAPIPFPKSSLYFDYYKHIGVLIYNKLALTFFADTQPGFNERIEDVNELRFIENGVNVKMVEIEPVQGVSVDTPKDLEKVRQIVAELDLQP
ncbi:3-deoxy-manno-octulosonate cytidylyltransferase [Agrobacterium sp. ES01]|uniref:3-deoxy-manno-octulosonate cytidylyltransferase n=1 Tax=Agrobacterium sp. ES01 TaxID=3420714 RepID=UPI003D148D80